MNQDSQMLHLSYLHSFGTEFWSVAPYKSELLSEGTVDFFGIILKQEFIHFLFLIVVYFSDAKFNFMKFSSIGE
jgi:hypothetical protein